MGKFLEHVIAALAWIGVIAAGVWFGAPLIWSHLMAAEQAVQAVKAQEGARAAETQAASRAQTACSAEVVHAMDAAKAIARAAQPQPIEAGKPRPMIGADQIKAMTQ
jgi:hypothetical protein